MEFNQAFNLVENWKSENFSRETTTMAEKQEIATLLQGTSKEEVTEEMLLGLLSQIKGEIVEEEVIDTEKEVKEEVIDTEKEVKEEVIDTEKEVKEEATSTILTEESKVEKIKKAFFN